MIFGRTRSIEKVEQAIKEHPDVKILAFVHAETSTGVRSDAESLGKLAKQNGILTIVDTVTSLGGITLKVDESTRRCLPEVKSAYLVLQVLRLLLFLLMRLKRLNRANLK